MEKLHLIKRHRLARRLGLRDMAKKLGVSHQAVADYEHGSYPPREEVWERMQKVLRLPGEMSDYWEEAGKPGKPALYEDALCVYPGCQTRPVANGLCRKHYQRERYARQTSADSHH